MFSDKEKIKQQIKQKENLIFNYIIKSISKHIQLICDYFTSKTLIILTGKKEFKKINIINRQLVEQIKINTPLHYFALRDYALGNVTNGLSVYEDNPQFEWYFSKMIEDQEYKSLILPYNYFLEDGLSWEMTKRILGDFVKQGVLKQKNAFGGQKFTLNNYEINKLKKNIYPSYKIIEFNGEEHYEEKRLKWIIDEFKTDEINKIFEEEKERIFNFL